MLHIPMMFALNAAAFNDAGYNTGGIRVWNPHGTDWIYQGGPDGNMRSDITYNQWDDQDNLPTTPMVWSAKNDIGPDGAVSIDDWLSNVGGGIY